MAVEVGERVLAQDQPEYAAKREELRQQGIKYVLAAYTDVHGVGKAKSVPIDHFTTMMRGSELFTGAALDGLGQEPSDDEPEPFEVARVEYRGDLVQFQLDLTSTADAGLAATWALTGVHADASL